MAPYQEVTKCMHPYLRIFNICLLTIQVFVSKRKLFDTKLAGIALSEKPTNVG